MLARHGIRPVFVPAQKEDWVLGVGRWVRRAEVGSAIRGSWVPAPLHYLGLFSRPGFLAMLTLRDIASMFRVFGGLLSALAIDPLREDQPLAGMTVADFCQGWSPLLTAFFTGLTRNALPAIPEELPAAGFIAFLRFYTLLRRDAWAFSYLPADGGTALVEPLVEKLRAYGGQIVTGARVTGLERRARRLAGRLAARWNIGCGGRSTSSWRSMRPPPRRSARRLHDGSTGGRSSACRAGTPPPLSASGSTARRVPPAPRPGSSTGDFTLDNFFWLHRIYDDYMRWGRATGGSAIEAHVYGPPRVAGRA